MKLPWRFGLFLILCLSAIPLALALPPGAAVMAGFDLAAVLFLASLAPLYGHDHEKMRERARNNEANRTTVLLLTVIVTMVLLVLVASELSQKSAPSAGALALILGTLAVAWLFANTVYALHYAYVFYSDNGKGKDCGGLDFPGEDEHPDYWDFTYFAFTLGMTFQTSDTGITTRAMRKVVTFHCLAAFVYNLGIVAFTINVLGGSGG